MTGWNMPPGVNESDIPGNRPEDVALQSLEDQIDEAIGHALADGVLSRPDVVEMLRVMVGDYDTP